MVAVCFFDGGYGLAPQIINLRTKDATMFDLTINGAKVSVTTPE